jgi:hypothetical protein
MTGSCSYGDLSFLASPGLRQCGCREDAAEIAGLDLYYIALHCIVLVAGVLGVNVLLIVHDSLD